MQNSHFCPESQTNAVALVPAFRITSLYSHGYSWPLSDRFNKDPDAYLADANLLAIKNGIGDRDGGDAVNAVAFLLEAKDLLEIAQNDCIYDVSVLDALTCHLNDYVNRLNGEYAYQGRTASSLAVVAPVDGSVSACADTLYRGHLLCVNAMELYSAAIALAKHVLKFEELLKLKRLRLV